MISKICSVSEGKSTALIVFTITFNTSHWVIFPFNTDSCERRYKLDSRGSTIHGDPVVGGGGGRGG